MSSDRYEEENFEEHNPLFTETYDPLEASLFLILSLEISENLLLLFLWILHTKLGMELFYLLIPNAV